MEIQEIDFFHQTTVQIRFNDIDSLGHVNNATIQEYFDLGRIEYFKTTFNTQINWKKFAAVIASIKTDFVLPIFINDKLVVRTKVTSIGNKSMQLIQHLTDNKGNIKVISSSTMVGFDHKTQTSLAITDEWKESMNKVEKGTIAFN
jgi:acyl-CoA thioester hydrolase